MVLSYTQSSYSYLTSVAITIPSAWTFYFFLVLSNLSLRTPLVIRQPLQFSPTLLTMFAEFYFYTASCSNASLYHIASFVMGVRDSRTLGKVKPCLPVASSGGPYQCHHHSWEALLGRPEVSAPEKPCGPEQVILQFRRISWTFSFWPGLMYAKVFPRLVVMWRGCKCLWVLVIF